MDLNTITPVITQFNNFIDSLIEDFKQYNLDEETLAFLVGKTRNFIDFSQLTLLNVIFGILNKLEEAGYDFSDEIKEAKNIINQIFERINQSLDIILPEEEEEEHIHDHGHGHHHHHHHIDVESVQGDVEKVVANLKSLKKLIGEIVNIALSTLKYQANEINQTVFDKEYENFRDNMKNFKQEFEKEE
jgi:hypothetical protein